MFRFLLGVRENTCATGTIIGPTSGLYIGGVPKNFVRRVGGPDSRKQVWYHVGCDINFILL